MNVLIIEDEKHTADLLQEMIEASRDFMVVEKLETIVDAVQFLAKFQSHLDLLFLDIKLADGYSFEIFKHIDVVTPIVFCTAYDEYAMKAIKNNGIDYLLKPFKAEEIQAALEKYQQLIGFLHTKNTTPLQFKTAEKIEYQRNFLAQFKDKTLVVKAEDIAVFYIKDEKVYLQAFNGQKYPFHKKLDYIESVCDPKDFFRINRQMLVNRKAIESFQDYFNRKVILELNVRPEKEPIVSRLKVSPFKEWLKALV